MTVVGVSLLVIGALWLLALVASTQTDLESLTLTRPKRGNDTLDVTIIVPARNEERNIGRCLSGLMAQRVREILVVNDRSEDATGPKARELAARDPRIRVVDGSHPPPDRTGKINALVTGVEAAGDTEWYLFIDADVTLDAGAVRAVINKAKAEQADVLSMWGRWIMPAFWVRLLQPVIGSIVRTTAQIEKVNDDARPEAFANGQFVLVRREAYEELGGWLAVKGRILEDVAFARHAKAAGKRVRMYYGKSLMSVIPYRSLPELWDGYRKNFVEGAGGVGWTLLFAALTVVFSIYPFVVGAWVLVQADLSGEPLMASWISVAALLCPLTIVGFRMVTARRFDHGTLEALLHPVANTLLVFLLLHAVWTSLRGTGVPWKGRVFKEEE